MGVERIRSEHPDVAACLNNLGLAWKTLGDAEKAIGYLERAYQMALAVPSWGADHPNTRKLKSSLERARQECKK